MRGYVLFQDKISKNNKVLMKLLLYVLLIYIGVLLVDAYTHMGTDFLHIGKNELKTDIKGWEITNSKGENLTREFPFSIFTEKGEILILQRRIPMNKKSVQVLAINTFFEDMRISVGDDVIYQRVSKKEGLFNKDSGTAMLFIPMPQKSAGKLVTIEIPSTNTVRGDIGVRNIYLGEFGEVFLRILYEFKTYIIILLTMSVFALINLKLFFILRGSKQTAEMIKFSLAVLVSGFLWASANSGLLYIFIQNILLINWIKYGAIIALNQAMIYYFNIKIKNHGLAPYRLVPFIGYVMSFLLYMLNVLGILSTGDFFPIVSVFSIATLVVSLVDIMRIILEEKRISKNGGFFLQLSNQIFPIMLCAMVLEFVSFAKTGFISSIYTLLAVIFFIAVVTSEATKKLIQEVELSKKNEIYKQIALFDEMTGIYNSNKFLLDMDANDTMSTNTVLIIFDINNLKFVNDTYGHAEGDKIIIKTAEIISQLFGDNDSIYRTGGDEFLVLRNDLEEAEIKTRIALIKASIKVYAENCNYDFDVAVGYTYYDPKIDKMIDDTKQRADELMYEEKERSKKRGMLQ